MTSQKTVAEVIADELYQAGVRTVFGQPGGEVVDLMEAMAQRGIEFVLMGLESGAALIWQSRPSIGPWSPKDLVYVAFLYAQNINYKPPWQNGSTPRKPPSSPCR